MRLRLNEGLNVVFDSSNSLIVFNLLFAFLCTCSKQTKEERQRKREREKEHSVNMNADPYDGLTKIYLIKICKFDFKLLPSFLFLLFQTTKFTSSFLKSSSAFRWPSLARSSASFCGDG